MRCFALWLRCPPPPQFFDALAELDHSHTYRSEVRQRNRNRQRSESSGGGGGGNGTGTKSRDDIEVGLGRFVPSPEGTCNTVWRRSWGGAAADLADRSTPPFGSFRGGGSRSRPAAVGEGSSGEGRGAGERRRSCRQLTSAALGWCYAPVLRKLDRRSVEQVGGALARNVC